MNMKVEMGKKYKTRDGQDVRLYCTDAGGKYSVHGAINNGGDWVVVCWTESGDLIGTGPASGSDLVEVKPKVKVDCWLNIYPGAVSLPHTTKTQADEGASGCRIACIHIEREVEHGEGL
jgi:hypothetical protein